MDVLDLKTLEILVVLHEALQKVNVLLTNCRVCFELTDSDRFDVLVLKCIFDFVVKSMLGPLDLIFLHL